MHLCDGGCVVAFTFYEGLLTWEGESAPLCDEGAMESAFCAGFPNCISICATPWYDFLWPYQ